MTDWKGRHIAFVSGASRGIGAHICRLLVQQGMIVIGCARSVVLIKAIAEEVPVKTSTGQLHAMKCDLSNEIEILAMFKEIRRRFGRIDVCVNNTCFSNTLLFSRCETIDLKNILEVNIMAVSICTRECLMLMNNVDDGRIIQVIQCGAVLRCHMNLPASVLGYKMYQGVKLAITAFTDALRRELKSAGSKIRVRCLYPNSKVTEYLYVSHSPKSNVYIRTEADVIAGYVKKMLAEVKKETAEDVKFSLDDFK